MKALSVLNFGIRLVVAIVIGILLFRFVGFSLFAPIAALIYGFVLWLLFGVPLLQKAGETAGLLFNPNDSNFRIMPEYSVAEARVKKGKYQEAIDEYRKVIAEHPDDIYPHLRIADLALNHLNDVKLAELELMSAFAKAKGEDTTALAAGRLADFYQHTLREPARALDVMKQLREKIPNTKQAKLAEERIAALEELRRGGTPPPKSPDKVSVRPSRYKMPE